MILSHFTYYNSFLTFTNNTMEDLSDPFGDRVMKNVPPLARFPLKKEEIWHQSRKYYSGLVECVNSASI